MRAFLLIASLLAAAPAQALTTTRCYWVGSTYTCNTFGDGGTSITRCTNVGGTMRCTTF